MQRFTLTAIPPSFGALTKLGSGFESEVKMEARRLVQVNEF